MPVPRSLMTNGSSRFFASRDSPYPGAGYPSCNTELCRIPGNRRDPVGYYAEIGVDPWASEDQIRTAVRHLYRRLHPDTGALPDIERLDRVKLIAEVLLDPESRARYNATPPGKRLLDRVYRSELSALNFTGVDRDMMERMLKPVPAVDAPVTAVRWYDYLAVDREQGDMHLAQRWYGALLAAAPVVGYRGRIAVLLHHGPAFHHPGTSVLAVPRPWTPSKALAFALFTAVVGIRPGVSDPTVVPQTV
jgi:hypothetical protein